MWAALSYKWVTKSGGTYTNARRCRYCHILMQTAIRTYFLVYSQITEFREQCWHTYQTVDLNPNLKIARDIRPTKENEKWLNQVSNKLALDSITQMKCKFIFRKSLTYIEKFVGKVSVSPLRPRCVLAKGVATVFSAPALIITKKECLVDSF